MGFSVNFHKTSGSIPHIYSVCVRGGDSIAHPSVFGLKEGITNIRAILGNSTLRRHFLTKMMEIELPKLNPSQQVNERVKLTLHVGYNISWFTFPGRLSAYEWGYVTL